MKKFLILLSALTAVLSCTKGAMPNEATYTIRHETNIERHIIEELGVMADVSIEFSVNEYYGSQRIGNTGFFSLGKGAFKTFTANERAEYITVLLQVTVKYDGRTSVEKRYVANAFYLEKGQNTMVVVDDNTSVSSREPVR